MRQFLALMRLRLALAVVGSLILHVLLLHLLPLIGAGKQARLPTPGPSHLQVRMLPPVAPPVADPPVADALAPRTGIEAQRPAPALDSPRQQQVSVRQQPAMAATTLVPQGETAGAPGVVGTAAPPVTSNADRNAQPRAPTAPLNLTIPTDQLPPRTALQTTIEQQAIRPDAIARSFERVLAQTDPVTTEITQTVDASGNVTVKVRTAGGTYCLKNSTPAGATLYELKTLTGNCH